ncbi:MAG: hypothetical protein QOH97_4115 [Actinoplanes sp.]|nr:hypothetical protein [Actinoplanes sp.]
MPRQRPAIRRMMLASGLAATVGVAGVIVSLTFANDSAAAETSTGTTRVSVSTSDLQAGADSAEPEISGDGRYVAFTTDEAFDPIDKIDTSQESTGGTAPETMRDADVYVRDTKLGTTTLISHGNLPQKTGPALPVPARGDSDQPSISANGRFVAFRTSALNIANGPIFAVHMIVVCDRDPDGDGTLNPTCTSTRISDLEYDASNPHLSADGQRLSYDVAAVEPPIEGTEPEDIDPEPAGRDPYLGWVEVVNLRIGADGTLGVPPLDDRTFLTGEPKVTTDDGTLKLLSQADSTMAAGGTQVAFVARFDGDEGQFTAVYGYDISALRLSRLDLDAAGHPVADPDHFFYQPALSGDGRRYAFTDFRKHQVLLYDRDPDANGVFGTPAREVASRLPDGTDGIAAQPAFSADGRYLAFTTTTRGMHNGTDDSNIPRSCLGPGPNQSYCDIVVRDVVVDHDRETKGLPRLPAELASPSVRCVGDPQPCEGTGDSGQPRLSEGSSLVSRDGRASLDADGSALAYGSSAADLIDHNADTNRHADVFKREFRPALAGDPVDFGEVPIDAEAVKDVPLTHVGSGPLSVTAVAVTGAGFDVFPGEACTTVVLHATESCVVSVRFKPTVAAAATGTLTVTIKGVDTPLTIALTGTGTALPVGTFAAGPDQLDFGKRPVLRKSPVKSITVRNTGVGPLSLGVVKLSAATAATFPADYQLTATACSGRTIPVGGSCRIDVRQRPTAVGVRPAVVTVAYTGPNGEALTFVAMLTGEGTAPTLVPSPNVTPAGRVIQITGTDFPPGSTAKLSLTGMPGTTTAKADANGRFKVPFVVLPSTWTGRRPLVAAVLPATAPGLTAPLQAQLEFVIVPGSPQPPDFDTRK